MIRLGFIGWVVGLTLPTRPTLAPALKCMEYDATAAAIDKRVRNTLAAFRKRANGMEKYSGGMIAREIRLVCDSVEKDLIR